MQVKICNVCGKPFNEWDNQEDFNLHYIIGYGSRYDGGRLNLDFCCECFDNFLDYILPQCSLPAIEGVGEI